MNPLPIVSEPLIRLRHGAAIAPVEPGRWQVRWDFDEVSFLEGAAVDRVLGWLPALLDGSRTITEIQTASLAHCTPDELRAVLDCLHSHGLLRFGKPHERTSVPDELPNVNQTTPTNEQLPPLPLRERARGEGSKAWLAEAANLSYCCDTPPQSESELPRAFTCELGLAVESLNADPETVRRRLAGVRIQVCGRSSLAFAAAQSLQSQGFDVPTIVSDEGEFESLANTWTSAVSDLAIPQPESAIAPPVIPLVIEQDWPGELLEAFNLRALSANQTWMLVAAWNRRVIVGPIFVPGQTACHACYRSRLDSHRRHLAAFRAFQAREVRTASAILPAIAELAAAWTALELFHHVAGIAVPRTLGRVLVYHPQEARLGVEVVLRIPWCRSCANLNRKMAPSRDGSNVSSDLISE